MLNKNISFAGEYEIHTIGRHFVAHYWPASTEVCARAASQQTFQSLWRQAGGKLRENKSESGVVGFIQHGVNSHVNFLIFVQLMIVFSVL
jgi:hypothetical protein